MTDASKVGWALVTFLALTIVALLAGAWALYVGFRGAEALGIGEVTYQDCFALAVGIAGAGFLFRLAGPTISVRHTKDTND